MAVVMVMHWPGVTQAQYEAVRGDIDWVTNMPDGSMLHIAGWADDGFRVTDLWQSAEQFQAFVDAKLMPAVQKAGIEGQPQVMIYPATNIDQMADLKA